MTAKPYAALVRFSESFLERHGDSYLGVGWTKRQEDADARYRVMLELSEVKLVCRTDGRCLWKHDLSKNAETIRLAGTALSLSDEHNLSILSTGNAPEIYLCDIPQLPDVPLELEVWIKAATDLAGAKQEVEDLRGAIAERDANLERLEAQAEALRAAITDRDGGKE